MNIAPKLNKLIEAAKECGIEVRYYPDWDEKRHIGLMEFTDIYDSEYCMTELLFDEDGNLIEE